jgi:hypothetical protein
MKKSCLSVMTLILLMVSAGAQADTCGTGKCWRLNNGASQNISEHSVCKFITNNSGKDVFIPVQTSAEWTAFWNNAPAGLALTIASCGGGGGDGSCTLPWGGTLAHGASVSAYASATVNSPSTCSAVTRTCTNGTLSGTGNFGSCSVSTNPLLASTGGTITEAGGYRIHTFTTSTLPKIFTASGSGMVEYLVVGGGGGGGYGFAGGGAGGVVMGRNNITAQSYIITIGNGGAGPTSNGNGNPVGANGSNGQLSRIFSMGSGGFPISATGGGGGGGRWSGFGPGINPGNGGSGGGGAAAYTVGGSTQTMVGGAGNLQGYAGGSGSPLTGNSDQLAGGGGGGAGGPGGSGTASGVGGNGGLGVTSYISGTLTYYAGGGASLGRFINGSPGISGGWPGQSGDPDSGGGGGASGGTNGIIGSGGSGIVIIRYPIFTDPITSATGGTISNAGGYCVHTFTTSQEFRPGGSGMVEYLVVGGGGGGGLTYAGGGAGGVRTGSMVVLPEVYPITIGNGGAGPTTSAGVGANGSNGEYSAINASDSNSIYHPVISAAGGGGGGGKWTGSTNGDGVPAGSGGSGGGGSAAYSGGGSTQTMPGGAGNTPATPYSVQGFAGGNGSPLTANAFLLAGGGGGGAGGAGGSGTAGGVGGNGGLGIASSISGTSTFYASGGGAVGQSGNGGASAGGGGAPNQSGAPNTGGGGGAVVAIPNGINGRGGSGIVILRYPCP